MQPHEMLTIVISDDGLVLMVDGETSRLIAEDLGVTVTQRASHVEPVNAVLRFAFQFIRERVTETSRVAQWTRSWNCLWRIRLEDAFGGHVLPETYRDRDEAIAREVRYLNEAFTR
jgi:hypothetical protein